MESLYERFVNSFSAWASSAGIPRFVNHHSWIWPACETIHFYGLCLLIGAVGAFDLRLLGLAKGLPVAPLKRLLRWGVLGFVLCLGTGIVFVTGNAFSTGEYFRNYSFLWKMLFIVAAGINLLVFHLTGTARAVETLGPEEDAPPLAKVVGAASLILWVGVIFFGRFLPVIGDAF